MIAGRATFAAPNYAKCIFTNIILRIAISARLPRLLQAYQLSCARDRYYVDVPSIRFIRFGNSKSRHNRFYILHIVNRCFYAAPFETTLVRHTYGAVSHYYRRHDCCLIRRVEARFGFLDTAHVEARSYGTRRPSLPDAGIPVPLTKERAARLVRTFHSKALQIASPVLSKEQ